jgi:hypothetical protein
MGVALSLLDAPGYFIGHPHRHLRDTLVGVDHLLEVVPYQIALNRDEVLHRSHTGQAAQTVDGIASGLQRDPQKESSFIFAPQNCLFSDPCTRDRGSEAQAFAPGA